MSEVRIYKRINAKYWGPIYTFEKEAINHIHNIIPDEKNKCVWILTGDFDNAAAIWRATDNLKRWNQLFLEINLQGVVLHFLLMENYYMPQIHHFIQI